MSLKGSKTEQNLKDAFAGESQANRRYLYFASKADVEAITTLPRYFVPPPKAKQATPTDTLSTSKRWVTLQPACLWGIRHQT